MSKVPNVTKDTRLVCLLAPEGADEAKLEAGWGSQSIIGLHQYRLMKRFSGFSNISLYSDGMSIGPDDVLLIMKCIPGITLDILAKFNRSIYYFDDMHAKKALRPEYSEPFSMVKAYISPLRAVAEEMNQQSVKKSYYMPWTMCDMPFSIEKTEHVSIFVDMDERAFTSFSIPRGFAFARTCLEMGISIHIFEKFIDECPADLREKINFIQRMPPLEFKKFLSTMWFYASGIASSYEYCVLESAMLGCGLISIHAAVKQEHLARPSCLLYDEETGFSSDLTKEIALFDKDAIIAAARQLYPQDSSVALLNILQDALAD